MPFEVAEFVDGCRGARREGHPHLAVRELLARATSARRDVEAVLGHEAGLATLHSSPDLTILHVVWPPGMSLFPHDHRMWAAIGVYTGQEDNAFYRRAPGGLLDSGGRQVCDGEVLLLGDDAIHAVANPRRSFTGSIHVYGGDLLATPRSEWDPAAMEERPYDVAAVFRYFEEQNAKLALG